MLFVKARSFLRAVWSFIRYGDVPLDLHDKRSAICHRCDHMRVTPGGIFCRVCECPHWFVSDLRTKWRMRDVKCPLNKW